MYREREEGKEMGWDGVQGQWATTGAQSGGDCFG